MTFSRGVLCLLLVLDRAVEMHFVIKLLLVCLASVYSVQFKRFVIHAHGCSSARQPSTDPSRVNTISNNGSEAPKRHQRPLCSTALVAFGQMHWPVVYRT
jgi:hypothetical protein